MIPQKYLQIVVRIDKNIKQYYIKNKAVKNDGFIFYR